MSEIWQSTSEGDLIKAAAKWGKLSDGVRYAIAAHASQTRKGSGIPCISHLLAVAAIVLEFGGDEDQAIAAMLHDVIEDQGAHHELSIRAEFGDRVANIVRGCTDADTVPKPPWRTRKEAYISRLLTVDADTLLVSAADKLHNIREICSDLRDLGDCVFDRFRGGRSGTLWYYAALGETFRDLMPGPLAEELWLGVSELHSLAGTALEVYLEQRGDSRAQQRSRREVFRAQLADVCVRMAVGRIDALAKVAKQRARERTPLIAGHEWGNFFDEYSILLARDETYIIEIYKDAVRSICGEVVDTLSDFERELLQRTTEQYGDFWRDDEPEPSTADARRWLAEEMYVQLTNEALDHGQTLTDAEADEEPET